MSDRDRRIVQSGSKRGRRYIDYLGRRSEHQTALELYAAKCHGIISWWMQTHPCSKESDFYAKMGASNRREKRILHRIILAIEVKARTYGYTLTLSHALKMIKEIPERLRNMRVIKLVVIWGNMPDAITESARRALAKHHIRLISLSQLMPTLQSIRETILNLFHVNDLSIVSHLNSLNIDGKLTRIDVIPDGYGGNTNTDDTYEGTYVGHMLHDSKSEGRDRARAAPKSRKSHILGYDALGTRYMINDYGRITMSNTWAIPWGRWSK